MGKRVLDYDPIFGTRYFDYDHDAKKIHVGDFQNVEPVFRNNERLKNDEERTKAGIKKGWFHVADIPYVLIPIIEKKYGLKPGGFLTLKDEKTFLKILNDSDFSKIKTTTKRI